MKVTKLSDNLYQLTVFRFANCYLVRETDGFTLIDSLISGQGDKILAAAKELGVPIKRIGITHAHVDHVGALDELVKQQKTSVFCSPLTAQFLQGNMMIPAELSQNKLRGGYVQAKVNPTRLLEDGDKIGSLRAIASPGHSPDHLAFFDERDGTLVAGDSLHIKGGLAVSGVLKLGFPFPALATWDKKTAVSSAEKLLALNPKRLATGHGHVLDNPVSAMENAVSVAKRKI